MFGDDLGGEGLRYYLSVPDYKRVGGDFVNIVRCLCTPQDVSVFAFYGLLMHRKRRARLGKLGKDRLKKGSRVAESFSGPPGMNNTASGV